MKLFLMVWFFMGFGLALSSEDINAKSEILLADGTYKPGSAITAWMGALTGMKKFIEPNGYKILQELIDSVKVYDDHLRKNDVSALKSLYRISAKSLMELSSHILNEKLSTADSNLVQACLKIAKLLENDGSLYDVADFVHRQVPKLLAAEK